MDEQLMIPTGGKKRSCKKRSCKKRSCKKRSCKKRSCKKRQSNGGQAQWRPMLPAIQ